MGWLYYFFLSPLELVAVFAEIRARIKIWVKFYQHILK
ncbi:hypothetical protein LEP1GSC171_1303 [Leptospira santarosai str. HAI1380]|uniref:Uncharacterized protein n=3 Tax=Leptospira santarosai TaxID=28183 RepID=M6UQG3_9LEPT|nr:hypothetical protein LEP1GSC179_0866 [Leptospira santarosai str. MOR084]EKO79947.1 hypothetical protein LEP1GSC068_0352 [Leptospira sp. Fiocruz LV3954]EMF90988.1 hypothetical protein LEP1GSC005_4087 [Leptospira santarosai str. ST188]EMI64024.1 hypothetical protein LEP1GSC076_2459 [Leptospira sp. Fiocruz LV4135]EMJ48682.1 hypothetical protein LEP1GSC169_3007 [Leptospira santarosai str. HAI1349]EMM86973.1 hypothetical protein LEP1GSC039_0941 [Leptospira santarosai str. 2000027870]EMN21022.1 